MVTTKYKVAKFASYSLMALVLCVLQNTPGLFALWGVRPMLVAAFAVCVAFFEKETAGGLFSILCGFLCDLFSPYVFGFYMIALFVFCVMMGLFTRDWLRPVAINAVISTFVCMLATMSVAFFFIFYLGQVADSGLYFVRHMLPLSLYTAACSLVLYYPTRWVHGYFQQKIEAA